MEKKRKEEGNAMENGDKKRHIDRFSSYKAYRKKEKDVSTFSGFGRDVINSSGSERKELWTSPYITYKPLKESR